MDLNTRRNGGGSSVPSRSDCCSRFGGYATSQAIRAVFLVAVVFVRISGGQPLPGTSPFLFNGDPALEMVEGIHRYLDRETEKGAAERERYWNRNYSSPQAYERSIEPNRERLRRMLGVVDQRVSAPSFELLGPFDTEPMRFNGFLARGVRWEVLPRLHGEGLLLEPSDASQGNVIALPHDDWRPQSLVTAPPPGREYAATLARNGYRVLIPYLIDRETRFSDLPGIRRTNLPHREFLYRMSFELGRHLIGYEVQKVLQAVSILSRDGGPIAVVGYGQGGLTALYASALDPRISTTVVSGYFGPRESVWRETIDRDVWGLLREFGDAEIASLIAPRRLIIDATSGPVENGQPPAAEGVRANAAPGSLGPTTRSDIRREFDRAQLYYHRLGVGDAIQLTEGVASSVSRQALRAIGVAGSPVRLSSESVVRVMPPEQTPNARRQFDEIVLWNHKLVKESPEVRERFFADADASSPERWQSTSSEQRRHFWQEVIGRLPDPDQAPNPRTRLLYDEPTFRGYEVMLDVWQDVFAYGILLLPKDLAPSERRPVVVFQHGLEGRPQDTVVGDSRFYHDIAAKLAAKGFIVYAPQNPYIGSTRFRQIQRKAHPLKLSLFSFVIGQHQQTLGWLKTLPNVDPERIGFYGLSYGGKTAMRVPAVLEDYALSICSADFNEWVWKNTSTTEEYSYLFSKEYDMIEFDLASVANYAEMAMLIAPRPFMVERGHADGVAPDVWVAYEYAKVRRFYSAVLKVPERTRIEFFDGPHTVNGKGTVEFLLKHLGPTRSR